ncbi:LacI family DNA-binding transcriptional regulator [Porticoccus sp. W117]|uniref:LacI family DNA-binding transcriptional regulator n=1 Tax=Porticoccus sp. W117 TaxID=3054777 RepID=UPI002595F9AB|nr:LacI family DNA-binding transcriptional regulator [Porticoccus sp. W117]MDM3872352.1 LacI family DNA-binding transcriptional regulator [Porticoccus sp. W117]
MSRRKHKKPTLKDVAKEAGVAVSTVSYVINGTSSISDEVRKRVFDVIEKIGYLQNSSARTMRTGRSMSLGLILPDLGNPFFPELAQSVENTAREYGYSTFLVDTDISQEIEREATRRLIRQGVDGIVWFPTTQDDTMSEFSGSVPVVVMDRQLGNYDTVIPNHRRGGELQAKFLLDNNHQTIAMVTGPLSVDNMRMRRDGFIQQIGDRATIAWEAENPFSMQLTSDVIEHITRRDVTAIVAGNDIIAIGIINELTKAGIRVPQDIAVVGFDDISWGQWITPPLTTIRMPISELGSEAVHFLMRRLEQPEAPKRSLTIDVELVPRESA